MEQTKYFTVDKLYIGIVKLINTALLALTSYSFGHGETVLAAAIGVIYAVSKGFLEIADIKSRTPQIYNYMKNSIAWLKDHTHFTYLLLSFMLIGYNAFEISRKSKILGLAKKEVADIRVKETADSLKFEQRLIQKQALIEQLKTANKTLYERIKSDSLINVVGRLTIKQQSDHIRAIIN